MNTFYLNSIAKKSTIFPFVHTLFTLFFLIVSLKQAFSVKLL